MKPVYFAANKNEVLVCFRILDKLYPKNKYYFVDRGAKFKPKYHRYRIKIDKRTL